MSTENNKIIAEFLEFQETTMGWYDYEEVLAKVEEDNTFDFLKFHSDWNWLMKVVSEIEKKGADFVLTTNYVEINYDEGNIISRIDCKSGIEIKLIYTLIIEFIKWYNNKKYYDNKHIR